MTGKKKQAQKPSAANNGKRAENPRKSAPQSGSGSAKGGAVSSNSAKRTPVKGAQNPQNSSKNSQNNRLSQNRANPAQNRANPSQNRRSANTAEAARNGSASGKRGVVKKSKKVKKTANPPVNRQTAMNGQNSVPRGQSRPAAQPSRSPAKPVNKQARKAADRAALAKTRADAPEKKRPYRGGNYTLYFILAAIVVVVVMVVLSNTVLFKCGTIEVVGTTRYTSEEIIAAAGVKTGDNLLHIDAKKAEDGVMNAFAFVDKVAVKKQYPTKIVVEITEAQNWFALNQGGKNVVISRGGRVLGEIPANGLVVVKGFEAESLETGSRLASKVDAKNDIIMEIFETAEKVGLADVTEIDLADRFSIKITVDDRIILNLGSSVQLESKLRVGKAFIEKETTEDDRVSVLLSNPEKFAVENLSQGQKPVQPSTAKPASTEPASSEPVQQDSAPEEQHNSPSSAAE